MMFNSYNLADLGLALRDIRNSLRLSQLDVKNKTGINEDTLRKIENGLVIPKYETLEILSTVYKCDLLKILYRCRENKQFYSYYNTIDRIITNNDVSLIQELIDDFKRVQTSQQVTSLLINHTELHQFDLFLTAIREYYQEDIQSSRNAEKILINALRMTISDFCVSNFNSYNYNLFEIRILLLIGLIRDKCDDLSISTKILYFILEDLMKKCDDDVELQKLILKIYCNLSYNYHKSDDHSNALKFSDEGISYAVKKENMSFLYVLYARKGIAEYFLGNKDHLDSLRKSIHLLEINKQFKLAELYKNTFLDKYDILL